MWENNEKLNDEDNNEILGKPFEEEEIKNGVFRMETNKAPGPDYIPIGFYQKCWSIVKDDLVAVFKDFYEGTLVVKRMNYGVITLLPKTKEN